MFIKINFKIKKAISRLLICTNIFGFKQISYNDKVISSEGDYQIIKNHLDKIKNINTQVVDLGDKAIIGNTSILDISSKEIGHLIVLESPRTFLDAVKKILMYSGIVLF